MKASNETIAAISTPAGSGGIALIRISGANAFEICDKIFAAKNGKKLAETKANSIVFGQILNRQSPSVNYIDEALVSVFRAPHSFTGEDTVEISCHGSTYIQQEIMRLLLANGCRLAMPGEFTQRAFLNGKMDLSQAEAVADLIAATSEKMHRLAMNQMRGGFSHELSAIRERLLHFTSLIELELDFSEEDVTFADRTELHTLANDIVQKISRLADSFHAGDAIKNGVAVAITGAPNVGKSTLLNALLNDERAIVSDIPGTTRDTIEETIHISGQLFRFIDTAGLRQHTADPIESLGIHRSFEQAEKAAIVLYLFDLTSAGDDLTAARTWLQTLQKPVLLLGTKNDLARRPPADDATTLYISCKLPSDIERVKKEIVRLACLPEVGNNDVVVANVRHYDALRRAQSALVRVVEGLQNNIPGDLLAQDIREGIHYLGEITGEGLITTDEVLGNIFKNFCIGK
ncbi:MAG: tRNA uridine-5-carboxymethylaminomethyl(34) synthesis GTPase MnmE [Tannerella sp.]|jgi:tRNA modification GTPase|nr:tRNA uridine-5-carboxymethylaminomethyl(34) synthesis GTPase MnmE [Tannerella sp.]